MTNLLMVVADLSILVVIVYLSMTNLLVAVADLSMSNLLLSRYHIFWQVHNCLPRCPIFIGTSFGRSMSCNNNSILVGKLPVLTVPTLNSVGWKLSCSGSSKVRQFSGKLTVLHACVP